MRFTGTVDSVKIGTREEFSDLGRWNVGCSGMGRRRDGERDEEIWQGSSVGLEENGAAIGIGWGRKIIAERREAKKSWGYGKGENL